jgi:superfamily II DNA or RNA helicase
MSIDVNVTRINNFEYSFKLSSKNGIKHIAKALTFINPDPFAYSRRIEKFDRKKFTFKIGMLTTLEKYVHMHNLSYQLTDYDFNLPSEIEIDNRMSGKYVHQRKAVESFYNKRFGIIVVPTRGGKTFIASEILRIFLDTDKGNFLFITDNTTLFTQAVNDIKEYFQSYGGIEIGEIRAGVVDISKRVTVGMIQTIQSTLSVRYKDINKKKELEKYFKELRFLCVDEIHDNCSDAKLKTYKKAKKLEYQLCLSATPYRAGALVQNLKLKEWSGDVIYNITEKKLRDRKVLSDYRVFMLLIDHNDIEYDVEVEDYNGYRKELIFKNKLRNQILISIIEILRELNLKTLVLFQNIEHGRNVENITGIPFISGKNDSEERENAKEKFLEGEGGFLLASNIFKKGVTLSSVQVLINVDGGLENANTIQKKGRVLGATKTKNKSLIIDFFDLYDAYFSEHSEARLNTYIEAIGEKRVGILDTSIDDWKETIKRWTIKWFEKDKNYSDMQ